MKVLDFPTHAASKAVAMIPNCAATRHIHFTLDGQGEAAFAGTFHYPIGQKCPLAPMM